MRWFFLILSFLLGAQAMGFETKESSCVITIVNERFSGERVRMQFSNELKTKDQCKSLAKMHSENFEPQNIRKKTVSFQWHAVKKSVSGIKRLSHTKKINRKYKVR